jgi:hypothetical protein
VRWSARIGRASSTRWPWWIIACHTHSTPVSASEPMNMKT